LDLFRWLDILIILVFHFVQLIIGAFLVLLLLLPESFQLYLSKPSSALKQHLNFINISITIIIRHILLNIEVLSSAEIGLRTILLSSRRKTMFVVTVS